VVLQGPRIVKFQNREHLDITQEKSRHILKKSMEVVTTNGVQRLEIGLSSLAIEMYMHEISERIYMGIFDRAKILNTHPFSLVLINFPDAFAPLKVYASKANYLATQKSLGVPIDDFDSVVAGKIHSNQTLYLFDYLSDLTDKNRTTKNWLTNAGLELVQIHNVANVGFIYEFHAP